jgi:acetolactate synthase I/II/III large subunit
MPESGKGRSVVGKGRDRIPGAEMTGAEAVAECIRREGIGHAFCVPGESYLSVIDALYGDSDISLITNRHEGGASFAAGAYAMVSGKPGVCLVTRGPGASNACIGVHAARQDSVPLVLFIGQVERNHYYREGLQEADFEAFFRPIAKWAIEVRDAARVPELVQRAFHVAKSGRPGPVAVSLPEDMLAEKAVMRFANPISVAVPDPSPVDARNLLEELVEVDKAVVIAGGGVSRSGARAELVEFSEKLSLPVFVADQRQDVFPNRHPNFLGHLFIGATEQQRQIVREAEVILAVGTRFSGDTAQDYTLLSHEQKVIHIDVDPGVFGMYMSPRIAMLSDARKALRALLEATEDVGSGRATERFGWIRSSRRALDSFADPDGAWAVDPDFADGAKVISELAAMLPEDAIVTVDAGNFQEWVHRFYPFERAGTFIGTASGAMGYAVPAALAAKLARPERTVVSVSGDGGFMMTIQELETAVRHEAPFVSIVLNNNMYGTIRMYQELWFPGRAYAMTLTNPDFAELARQFGAHGERVEKTEEIAPALERALASGKPAVVEVLTDPNRITVDATLADLREKAQPD